MGHQALRDRIPSFDIRPARNALKLVRGELNNLIHHTMFTLTQRTLHGRRVFDILRFFGSLFCLFLPSISTLNGYSYIPSNTFQ